MKSLDKSEHSSRIASVHNGSSLFTGDAGGGESNIRRHIIENDYLEAIIQLPNNLFYNTGITTYIWILSNNKKAHRKGKVQLIDASQMYKKLRKNLGNKNCELSEQHINAIVENYVNMQVQQRTQDDGIASQLFDNQDFGCYKVSIERPKRLIAQFSQQKIDTLRYDKAIKQPMQWAYETYGNEIYANLIDYKKSILEWCEQNELNLSSANRTKLLKQATWEKHLKLLMTAQELMQAIGTEEHTDFNLFKGQVEAQLKQSKIKLTASEKNSIYNAITRYDAKAKKVIKKQINFKPKQLTEFLNHLGCQKQQLADYGYFATKKNNQYITYETATDLKDFENIQLSQNIHDYFIKEVKPHVDEAWINLDSVKIGYEISFNKYFYKHKPLRDLQTVSDEILALEQQSEGLIAEILGIEHV